MSKSGMYIMARGGGSNFRATAAWLFGSPEEIWTNKAVQLRLHGPSLNNPAPDSKPVPKSFDEFLSRLDSGERIMLGANIVAIWKCSGCKPADECEWHRLIKETAKHIASFEQEILPLGGHIINDSGVIVNPPLGQD